MITPAVAEQAWIEALRETPPWQPPRKPTIVIAPHPDDETLGLGGLIAEQRRREIPVTVVAVTDGEAAYAGIQGLGPVRQTEQERALEALGVNVDHIIRLRLPDSNVAAHETRLIDLMTPLFGGDALVMAPWHLDFHPDHEACGRAARRAAEIAGATLVSYVFWAWHCGAPPIVLAEPIYRFDLDDYHQTAKRAALACHRSQLQRDDGQPPILPESLLAPAKRSFETFIIHD